MIIEPIISQLPSIPVQEILILLASLFGALTVASLAARLRIHVGPAPARALADYVGKDEAVDPTEQMGRWLLQRLPGLAAISNVEGHRRWLALAGHPPSLAATLGLAVLLATGGGLLAVLSGVPIAGALAVLGGVYPFLRLRGGANRVRRQVERALPELTALMAAEMAAGNPPDKALARAGEWGGPLAALVAGAVAQARALGRPLFGRGALPGVFLEVIDEYRLPSLRAFAAQVDLAARKGAAGPELMESLARMLVLEYKERALREAEKLDSRLAVPTVLFFFLPFLFLILTPLMMPVLDLL
ncbi:MAG: type II secretion system F family protein [Caldilineaceae bacterium]|nr:type II secretion system F family protein [Caldilineaceae bacterium]